MITCDICNEEMDEIDEAMTIHEETICPDCIQSDGYIKCEKCEQYTREPSGKLCETCDDHFGEPEWIKDTEYNSHEEFMEHYDPDRSDD